MTTNPTTREEAVAKIEELRVLRDLFIDALVIYQNADAAQRLMECFKAGIQWLDAHNVRYYVDRDARLPKLIDDREDNDAREREEEALRYHERP